MPLNVKLDSQQLFSIPWIIKSTLFNMANRSFSFLIIWSNKVIFSNYIRPTSDDPIKDLMNLSLHHCCWILVWPGIGSDEKKRIRRNKGVAKSFRHLMSSPNRPQSDLSALHISNKHAEWIIHMGIKSCVGWGGESNFETTQSFPPHHCDSPVRVLFVLTAVADDGYHHPSLELAGGRKRLPRVVYLLSYFVHRRHWVIWMDQLQSCFCLVYTNIIAPFLINIFKFKIIIHLI